MNVLAIYAVNQHLADLHEEARRNRLAAAITERPSLLDRLLAAVRSGFGGGSSASPTAASAA